MPDIELFWKKLLLDIHKKGHIHYKDDAEIKELLNISGFVDNPLLEIAPNYSMFSKEQYITFLEQGVFDIEGYNLKGKALADYVKSLNNKEHIYLTDEKDFVYTYPQRLRSIELCDKSGDFCAYNQVQIICNRLMENIGTNRAVATLYSAGLDKDEEHIPCLNWLQALVRDDKMFLSVMFRSNDIYNAFPSNMHFITYIGLTIIEEIKEKYPSLQFEGIYYQCSSAHYYTNELNETMIKGIIGGD